ncbi:MAG: glycosyltransferase [Planctomycetota bacterium]|jgi:glycosyltransferase involved in cell wall biosynthesis|nr:glycosyltransferase [Planctomycetota bacterium]
MKPACVSVIIPVYNTAPWLRRCLDSVVGQTLREIEIIAVNDGSTDNSLEILREYAAADNRVKIIDGANNSGAAAARNAGIDAATGEYLGFIDSDDYIDMDFYEKLYRKAQATGAEIVKGADWRRITGEIVETDRFNDRIRHHRAYFSTQYVTAIFKTGFIHENNLYFPGLLVGEDQVFSIKAAVLSNKVAIEGTAQYYYIRREGSANPLKYSSAQVAAFVESRRLLLEFSLSRRIDEQTHRIIALSLLADTEHVIRYRTITDDDTRAVETIKETIKDAKKIHLLFEAAVLGRIASNDTSRSGIFWVAYNLLRYLANDCRFVITLYLATDNAVVRDVFRRHDFFKKFKCVSAAYRVKRNNKVELISNPVAVSPLDYDAYFNSASAEVLKYTAVDGLMIRQFCVLHDTIPLLLAHFPAQWRIGFYSVLAAIFDSCPHCFCVSQSCKNDFLRFYPYLDANKMTVTPNATAQNLTPVKNAERLKTIFNKYGVKYDETPKYIFSLCSLEPRKGLLFTIDCFLKFIAKHHIDDLYFYLGGGAWATFVDALRQKFASCSENELNKVITLGYVDDEDVALLYSHSLFFTYISEYEGFGMPPLEAMSCGVPVITSNTSSLPEVVGDAAIMITPNDEEACVKAFEDLYFNENRRAELREKGLARAKLFSWEKTGKTIADKIVEVVTNGNS